MSVKQDIRSQIAGALATAKFPIETPEALLAAMPQGADTKCKSGNVEVTAGEAGKLLKADDFPFASAGLCASLGDQKYGGGGLSFHENENAFLEALPSHNILNLPPLPAESGSNNHKSVMQASFAISVLHRSASRYYVLLRWYWIAVQSVAEPWDVFSKILYSQPCNEWRMRCGVRVSASEIRVIP